jgi:2-methylaconitate isomerase
VSEVLRLPAVFLRGGTSKGLFFREGVLPADPAERDRVLLRALGGGDRFGSEIDGLGGATSSTSKVVVVSPSRREGFDVDYLFAQVAVTTPTVDWSGSCGNLASAVGPFAIDEGLVTATGDPTMVRIWQQNTSKEIIAHVPTSGGHVVTEGDFYLDGVPYPAARIRLDFMNPGGSMTGRLLPTGHLVDAIDVKGIGMVRTTMLDAGNPCVFVAARDLGFSGVELRSALNADADALRRLEAVRAQAAVVMGLAPSADVASRDHQANPKVAIVCPPRPHTVSGGRAIEAAEVDLVTRMVSMGLVHHAMPATGSTALALAALIPGTVPYEAAGNPADGLVRIGHSSGIIPVEAELEGTEGNWNAKRVTVWRSARRLMEGVVLVPAALRPPQRVEQRLHGRLGLQVLDELNHLGRADLRQDRSRGRGELLGNLGPAEGVGGVAVRDRPVVRVALAVAPEDRHPDGALIERRVAGDADPVAGELQDRGIGHPLGRELPGPALPVM